MDVASDMTKELSGAEAEVEAAQAALEAARDATKVAEAAYRQRQGDEDAKAEAHARAIARVRELYATRREALEEQRRVAEEGLRALESKLDALKAENERPLAPTVDLARMREDAATTNGNGGAGSTTDGDWYERLLREAETEKGEVAE